MSKKSNTRAAQGSGTIRQRQDGRWEARYTVGRDPGTGKQIQKSVYGATEKKVLKKLQQITVDIENGVYCEPSRLTVGIWLDIWANEYLGSVKPRTAENYKTVCRLHLKPAIGAIKLSSLSAHMVQGIYNQLQKESKDQNGKVKGGLSAKTVNCTHGILHKALQQAVKLNYIKYNPCDACELPRIEKKRNKTT